MTTLTALEDRLRDSDEYAQTVFVELVSVRSRLTRAMTNPIAPEEYQHFALLLEAVIQSEDIIKIIYFRYHNTELNTGKSQ